MNDLTFDHDRLAAYLDPADMLDELDRLAFGVAYGQPVLLHPDDFLRLVQYAVELQADSAAYAEQWGL